MKLHGMSLSTTELRKRVGNMDQLASIRTVQLDDANERPTRAAIIHTGSGLEVTLLPDRGLDIASAAFQGKAMGWRSTVGDVAPQYYNAAGIQWLRSYFGGLLTTCGLTNVGAPAPDSAFSGNGLHGRISNTPARNLKIAQEWQGRDYVLSISGTMRETVLFGENLTLTRTVWTKLGERRFWLRDVVTNEGFRKTGLMILYHCNIGWPALDAGSELILPSRLVAPRDACAADGQDRWNKMDAPIHGYAEKVYYHDMRPARDGTVTVALVNSAFSRGEGFGVYVKFNKKELPRFTQWKMLGEQDYVVGLEPCNCGVEGRAVDEKLGLLETIRPGERRIFHLEFGTITTLAELKALRASTRAIETKIVSSYRDFVRKRRQTR